jgi:acetyl-CoA C-acetyltransferase
MRLPKRCAVGWHGGHEPSAQRSLGRRLAGKKPCQTTDSQRASGLMAITTAAKQVIVDGMDVVLAGGHDNITAVQKDFTGWVAREKVPLVVQHQYGHC